MDSCLREDSKKEALDFLKEDGSMSKAWGFFKTARCGASDPRVHTQWSEAGKLGMPTAS